MMSTTKSSLSKPLYSLILLSGFSALAWETIWQIKSTLALGVSAWGTAITLAITMGGMGLGGLLMGHWLRHGLSLHAVRLYGLLEFIIGMAGLLLNAAFGGLEKLDQWAYAAGTFGLSFVYIMGMIAIIGVPALCMGATLPVFGAITQRYSLSMAKLYGFNAFGAAVGVLVVAFIVIPLLGVTHTIWTISIINLIIACATLASPLVGEADAQRRVRGSGVEIQTHHLLEIGNSLSFSAPLPFTRQASHVGLSHKGRGGAKQVFIVFATGFATFILEIAWFRSLISVLPSTTDVFAIILACTLIALSLAAKKVSVLKQKKKLLGTQLCIAGTCILLVTPLIERVGNIHVYFKQILAHIKPSMPTYAATIPNPTLNSDTFIGNGYATALYALHIFVLFSLIYLLITPAMRFLGIAFPWIIDDHRSSFTIGKLYAINTVAAIIGSIGAAWFLLPLIGLAKTAWIAGIFVVIAGMLVLPNKKRLLWAALGLIALLIAMYFESGIGKTHVQGYFATDDQGKATKILGFFEGPDATVSAVEYDDGTRALLINSTLAAWESEKYRSSIHYMAWMGHLPMLLHPAPKKALVICFGTGQTANAVRKENPEQLDIVDLNARVFQLAHFFKSNENVLEDPRTKTYVMDGRAYLRRTKTFYDVITLEPMPPGTAGTNALYSEEFYESVRKRLNDNGIVAQWLPLHIVAPYYSASIAKTFQHVFPNSILWLDPLSHTGILLGTKNKTIDLTQNWPGLTRTTSIRNLTNEQIPKYVALDAKELAQYSQYGTVISDDNQLLAYGKVLYLSNLLQENLALLHRVK